MGFSRQEYWSGLPGPPPGDLPNPGIESTSLTSSALADGYKKQYSGGGPTDMQTMSKQSKEGTSLVVQGLRLCAPNAEEPGLSFVRELDPKYNN